MEPWSCTLAKNHGRLNLSVSAPFALVLSALGTRCSTETGGAVPGWETLRQYGSWTCLEVPSHSLRCQPHRTCAVALWNWIYTRCRAPWQIETVKPVELVLSLCGKRKTCFKSCIVLPSIFQPLRVQTFRTKLQSITILDTLRTFLSRDQLQWVLQVCNTLKKLSFA